MIIQGFNKEVGSVQAWNASNQSRGFFSAPYDKYTRRSVTREASMGIGAFYACVRLIATTVSGLPLQMIDRYQPWMVDNESQTALRLRDKPNAHTSGSMFWGTVAQHLACVGNAYALKLPPVDGLNKTPELYLAKPDASFAYHDEQGVLMFSLAAPGGGTVTAHHSHVIHFKMFGLDDTLMGHNPIALLRHSLGTSLSMQEMQGRALENDGRPSGVLSIPGVLKKEQAETIRLQWQGLYSGAQNQGKIAVLDNGGSFQPVSMTNADAQFIEQQKLGRVDVAGMFNMPPSLIGAEGESSVYKNTNDRRMDMLTFGVMPYLGSIESTLNLDEDMCGVDSVMVPRFFTQEFLRPNAQARFIMHQSGIAAGFLSVNEARFIEGLAPIMGESDE